MPTQLGEQTLCLDARKKLSTLYAQRMCCLDFKDFLCCDDDDDDPWVSYYKTLWETSERCSVQFHGVKLCMNSQNWKVEDYQLKWLPSMFLFLLWECSIGNMFWWWLSRLQGGARKWEIKACGQCFYKCGRHLWLDEWPHEHGPAPAVERQVSIFYISLCPWKTLSCGPVIESIFYISLCPCKTLPCQHVAKSIFSYHVKQFPLADGSTDLFQSCIHFLACNIWMWQVAQVVFPWHKALLKFVLQLHCTLQTFLLQISEECFVVSFCFVSFSD